jgi:hypothetical protein
VEGGYHFEHITLNGPDGDGKLRTAYPPHIGDIISLYDPFKKTGGRFEVVAREWRHSSYGSPMWPVLDDVPK